ncbi:MAG: glycosyltransferase family 4 protein, partial [Chlorobia bacterium]|nr:glycosyltransferase family 4 protein [Fimbriimonadaceae bacterium]
MSGRLGLRSWNRHETGRFSYDAIAQDLDRRVAQRLGRGDIDAVYAYEDFAAHTFRAAHRLDARRIYELPIGHWRLGRRIFQEEASLRPEWAMTLEGLNDSPEKLERKDQEARLAQDIIVPSEFVAASLAECPGVEGRIHVVNYGCPTPADHLAYRDSGPLRVLFVGSLGARKGVPYVLEAVEDLDIELTLVGPLPGTRCLALESGIEKHRYLGSIPRDRVLDEMRSNEVFLFPSLFEGLANVLLEAMSQGLAPITTTNSGAQGVVDDGHDGFLVPIRSVESIRSRLTELIEDRDKLNRMRASA